MNATFLRLAFAAGIVVAAAGVAHADDAPAWLRQAAAQSAPAYPKDTPAVVVTDESTITVSNDGRTVSSNRYAVRILAREGRTYARLRASYIPGTSKVRDLKAWLIRDGQVKAYGKGDVVDMAASPYDMFDEGRTATLSAADDADAGSIVGFEYTVEDRPLLSEDEWAFQGRLPVLSSRLTLVLPQGWTASSVTFNHEPVAPTVNGSSWTWELRLMPPIPEEPAAPPVTNLAPRLAFSYAPPAGGRPGAAFTNWTAVAQWSTALVASQGAPNEAITAKAKELTAGAATELDRIRQIGRYVQGVNYVSIQTNLARGGGYRPHAASEVFARSYGDCKDKANLMLAMLRSVGIESYLMAIYAGDPTYVREDWATPAQFNHCILAVRVGPGTEAPTVFDNPSLGRLLAFDPTDPYAPVGDLPEHLQGSLALLMAGDAGGLVRMPVTPPDKNRVERTTTARLTPEGAITGTMSERATGHEAVDFRAEFERMSRSDYDAAIGRWLSDGITGVRVSRIAPSDDRPANRFGLDLEFAADRYAQVMRGQLFIFKPAVASRFGSVVLRSDAPRTQPVVIEGQSFSEKATFTLPPGFAVDEMPEPVRIETEFGAFETVCAEKDGVLTFTRSLRLNRTTVPVSAYPAVRSFYDRIRDAEGAPVVLIRK